MITNFRDIGNISVPDGTLKKNFFFRSGELVDLTLEDQKLITNHYFISRIFDFRNQHEIEQAPDTTINNVNITNINILDSNNNTPSLQNLELLTPSNVDSHMKNIYTDLVLNSTALKGYNTFLLDILSSNNPIIFHCFAGKDRTGIAAALILKISGATDEQIMVDYLKTNIQRQKVNKIIIDKISNQTNLSLKQLSALESALTVKEDYLTHAKNEVIKTYGTFGNFFTSGLQLNKEYITEFRKKFIY